MNRVESKKTRAIRRQNRVRTSLRSASPRPRLSVFISNRNISAQIIDDSVHKTLVSASTTGKDVTKGNMTEKAVAVGKEIAKKAKAKKITEVALDRGPRLFHGRIKALADAAREEGLKI
ncbi:MAG TPA: 50S ribosomal protein L18 [Candidatus Saccharimonadales bacterium]|nr:50S ribosomal protein L18 [Candidatus Saccharimonadales bacterium]